MKSSQLDEREFCLRDEGDPSRAIRGRLLYPSGVEEAHERLPYVLCLHGFKGFMDWGFFPEAARRLAAHGLAVVSFNFSGSGHGDRPLEFTEPEAFFENTPSKEIEDLDRVRSWLDADAVPWIDPRRGALLGHSLGGAVALVHAARRQDYRAVVAWASVSTFRRFPSEVEELWRKQGFVEIPNMRTKEVHRLGLGWLKDIDSNPRALDVHGACRRLAAPIFFLHGTEDDAVPLEEGQSLFEACAPGMARFETIEGANHTFWATHPLAGISPGLERVLHASAEFLAEKLA